MTDCPSTIEIHDDRHGPIRDYCELPAGHEGEHRSDRTACDKRAWFVWTDEPSIRPAAPAPSVGP